MRIYCGLCGDIYGFAGNKEEHKHTTTLSMVCGVTDFSHAWSPADLGLQIQLLRIPANTTPPLYTSNPNSFFTRDTATEPSCSAHVLSVTSQRSSRTRRAAQDATLQTLFGFPALTYRLVAILLSMLYSMELVHLISWERTLISRDEGPVFNVTAP